MLFSDSIDEIINESMRQYTKLGKENTPESLRILTQAPKIIGFTILPPLVLDLGMINFDGQTHAIIMGWYVWTNPNISLADIASQLMSLEDVLDENDEEDSEDSD